MINSTINRYIILIFILCIGIFLLKDLYFINPWPTDAYSLYVPMAVKIKQSGWIASQGFHVSKAGLSSFAMFGKETLLILTAIFQALLRDYETIYPIVVVLIVATLASAILIYWILTRLFSPFVGLLGFLIFSLSFWPYQYILQASHQPLVTLFCLLSVAFILKRRNRLLGLFLSGVSLGLMIFSSPTAVIYFPYIAAAAVYVYRRNFRWAYLVVGLSGVIPVVLYMTYPNIWMYILFFKKVIAYSHHLNNFIVFQDELKDLSIISPGFRGEGLGWVWAYFINNHTMLFVSVILSIFYLIKDSVKNYYNVLIVFLGVSAIILVELSHVAQFGRNYYAFLLGMILVIILACQRVLSNKSAKWPGVMMLLVLIVYGWVNASIFLSDVRPSRMATNAIYNWLIEHHVEKIYVHKDHPYEKFLYSNLNNPKYDEKIVIQHVGSIEEVDNGYVLLAPSTGLSIWGNCAEKDFLGDQALNYLVSTGKFESLVVAQFPTMVSSHVWPNEEEVCAYRNLVTGEISGVDQAKKLAYIIRMGQ